MYNNLYQSRSEYAHINKPHPQSLCDKVTNSEERPSGRVVLCIHSSSFENLRTRASFDERGVFDRLRQSRRYGNIEAAVSAVRKAVHSIAHIEPCELAFGTYNAGQDAGAGGSCRLSGGGLSCVIVLLVA